MPIRRELQLAFACLAGMFLPLAGGCVGHDQLRLKDPSPCHMQCQFNSVAQLDPECHGYHPTCWAPWAADCPGCPPPLSGVYPVMMGPMGPEPVAPPQPVLKTPQQKLPPPDASPPPTEPTPALPGPLTPSEPTPAPSESMPPAGGMPAPNEGMPAPGSNETQPETTPAVPDLPPLMPPGREIPGPQPKKSKSGDQNSEKTGALLNGIFPDSNLCQHAVPLGTITALNEPAKLQPQQSQPLAPESPAQSSIASAPPERSSSEVSPSEASPSEASPPAAAEPDEKAGIAQAIYQAVVPSASAAQTDAAADEAERTDEAAQTDETAAPIDETADPDESVAADAPADHRPLFHRLGGILIVACSLACGGLYLKSLMARDDELSAEA